MMTQNIPKKENPINPEPDNDISRQDESTITIFAQVSDNQVKLTVDGQPLSQDGRILDHFDFLHPDATVLVKVASEHDQVTVTNNPSNTGPNWLSWHDVQTGYYYSEAWLPGPGGPGELSYGFTIHVGALSHDPTVVISRSGSGSNAALRIVPRPV